MCNIKAVSFMYPSKNFTLGWFFLHNQRLWWLWQIWSMHLTEYYIRMLLQTRSAFPEYIWRVYALSILLRRLLTFQRNPTFVWISKSFSWTPSQSNINCATAGYFPFQVLEPQEIDMKIRLIRWFHHGWKEDVKAQVNDIYHASLFVYLSKKTYKGGRDISQYKI